MGADDPVKDGWLPPRAPGGGPAPHFEPAPHEPAPGFEPPAGAPPAPDPAHPAAPAGPPRFVTGRGRTDVTAAVAMTLGIVGLGLLILTAGLGFALTIPFSGIAWLLGARARARAEVAADAVGARRGRTGQLLGLVGVALGVVAGVAWIVAMALGVDPQELQHELERQSDASMSQAVVEAARALLSR